ncbi:MAG: GldG family protein, partial [Treponema sp.]|nr:GldG family protein [Treponema sp.]
YEQLSSRVKLEYVDLIRNPDFSARFPEEKFNVNDILISSGGNVRKLTSSDLFNIRSSYYGSYVASSKAEQAMTSALLNVTSDKKFLAAVIEGHDGADVSAFVELLQLNAWETVDLNLITEDIPPEASLLILARPSRDLDIAELQKLDAFLGEGRDRTLFYLTDIDQPSLPNLTDFLAEWGIAVESGLVYETSSSRILMSNPYVALADFAEEKYAKNVSVKDLYPVIPQARPLKVLWEARGWRTASTLINTSGTSGVRPLDAPPDWTPESSLSGGVPILALSDFYRTNPQSEALSGHVLVCGSTLALVPTMLGNPNLANSAYFLDLLGQLAKRDDQVYVQDKTLGFTELRVTGEQVMLFTLIFVGLLPLAVLVAGIVVWLRRRHK